MQACCLYPIPCPHAYLDNHFILVSYIPNHDLFCAYFRTKFYASNAARSIKAGQDEGRGER